MFVYAKVRNVLELTEDVSLLCYEGRKEHHDSNNFRKTVYTEITNIVLRATLAPLGPPRPYILNLNLMNTRFTQMGNTTRRLASQVL